MKNLINVEAYDSIEEELRNEATKLKKQYKYNPNRDWWLKEVLRSKGTKQKH
jgi:N-acetylglucosamine-6-sulfatase